MRSNSELGSDFGENDQDRASEEFPKVARIDSVSKNVDLCNPCSAVLSFWMQDCVPKLEIR